MANGVRHAGVPNGTGLTILHARYGRWLTQRLRLSYGVDAGDEIAQATWLKVAALEAIDTIRHPKAFLLRVAKNSFISEQRRGSLANRHAADISAFSVAVQAEQEQAAFLRDVILSLPQPLRDVFVLSRFGGLTNRQIADQLGISPKTVEWRMTKALAHCAAQFRR